MAGPSGYAILIIVICRERNVTTATISTATVVLLTANRKLADVNTGAIMEAVGDSVLFIMAIHTILFHQAAPCAATEPGKVLKIAMTATEMMETAAVRIAPSKQIVHAFMQSMPTTWTMFTDIIWVTIVRR